PSPALRAPSPLRYVFSAPTKRGRSAALRPLHRPPVPGARENPQRHGDCATRKRCKRRAPFPRATTTVNTERRSRNPIVLVVVLVLVLVLDWVSWLDYEDEDEDEDDEEKFARRANILRGSST